MNVLITGGAGFIGSHLADALAARPDINSIRVVDNLCTGKLSNLNTAASRIEFINEDLSSQDICAKAVAGIDVIFHQAAIPSVPRSVDDPLANHICGDHLTVQLLDAARKNGVQRVVFAASSAAYGNSEISPKHEGLPPDPLSPYAASKLAGEYYLAAFARCYNIDTVSLRYFNVYGPRQDPGSPYSGVIAKACRFYCANEPLTVFGDGTQSRDFVYVQDIVRANILAALHPQRLNGQVFNIGTGESLTLNAILAALKEITGLDRAPKHAAARIGDVLHSLADISKAKNILGYHPQTPPLQGLRKTYEWYRDEIPHGA